GYESLGIASASAVDKLVVFPELYIRRHGVDVSREDDVGVAASRVDVRPVAADVLQFDFVSGAAKILGEKTCYASLVLADGRDFDQRACQFEDVHRFRPEVRAILLAGLIE